MPSCWLRCWWRPLGNVDLRYIYCHYGPRHLSEISGLNAPLTVFASAIGQSLFFVAYDASRTSAPGHMLSVIGLLALLKVTVFVKQPLDLASEH